MIKALWERVQRWYEGEPKIDSDPAHFYIDRHWTAEVARSTIEYIRTNLGHILAAIGIALTIISLL